MNTVTESHFPSPLQGILKDNSTPKRYAVELTNEQDERIHHKLSVHAWVADETLVIHIFTKDGEGRRHPDLRGKEQYDRILRHFDGQFKRIVGFWAVFNVHLNTFDGTDEKRGTNLSQFNQAIRAGDSKEEAAAKTWSAQQAFRHGYTAIDVENMRGEEGNFYSVRVYFSKPDIHLDAESLNSSEK